MTENIFDRFDPKPQAGPPAAAAATANVFDQFDSKPEAARSATATTANVFDRFDPPTAPSAVAAFDAARAAQVQRPQGYGVLDLPKEVGAGALHAAGSAVSGMGAFGRMVAGPIVKAANALAGSEVLSEPVNPFEPIGSGISHLGKALADTESDAAKAAKAKLIIRGDLMQPSSLELGEGARSPMALALGGANLAGEMVPMLAGGLVSRGMKLAPELAKAWPAVAEKIASKQALTAGEAAIAEAATAAMKKAGRRALGAGAAIGGLQGAESSAESERERLLDPDLDLSTVPGYQQRVAAGMSPDAARAALVDEAGQRVFEATLPVATAASAIGTAPLLHDAQSVLSKVAGSSVARRVAVGAGVEGPLQAALAVGQNAAQIAGANAETGEDRSLTENSAPIAGMGAVMGAGFGAVGGLTTRPRMPFPQAKPGTIADAANAIHEHGGAGGADFIGDVQGNSVDVGAPAASAATRAEPPLADPTQLQPSTVSAASMVQRARAALDALDAKAHGTPDTTTSGPDGKPAMVPGEPPQGLSEGERELHAFLAANLDNPAALAQKVGLTLEASPTPGEATQSAGAQHIPMPETNAVGELPGQYAPAREGAADSSATSTRAHARAIPAETPNSGAQQMTGAPAGHPVAEAVVRAHADLESRSRALAEAFGDTPIPADVRQHVAALVARTHGIPVEALTRAEPVAGAAMIGGAASPYPGHAGETGRAENRTKPDIATSSEQSGELQSAPSADHEPRPSHDPSHDPFYDMSLDELDTHAQSVIDRGARTEAAILGDHLRSWQAAQRALNSRDRNVSTRASQAIEEIEATLPQADRDALYGIGDDAYIWDDVADYRRALQAAQVDSPAEAVEHLAHLLPKLGDTKGSDPSGWNREQQVAYSALREVRDRVASDGWDSASIQREAIQRAAQRFTDPADAAFMLERFMPAQADEATPPAVPTAPVLSPPRPATLTDADLKAELSRRFDEGAMGGPKVPASAALAKQWGVPLARAKAVRSEVVAERRARVSTAAAPRKGRSGAENAASHRAASPNNAAQQPPTKPNTAAGRAGGGEARLPAKDGNPTAPVAQSVEGAARESAAHPANQLSEPSPAQHAAGNFKAGHVRLHGLDVTIQVPKGGLRRGTDRSGQPWEREASAHYGHVRRTEGADGEPVDVYLGPQAARKDAKVFVIDQVAPGTKRFDEHKAMVGFAKGSDARRAYDANFPKGLKTFGGVREMSIGEFKQWVNAGDLSKPASVTGPATLRSARDSAPRVPAAGKGGEMPAGGAAPLATGDPTATPEFRRFFGASKVVNAKGEPLTLHHGTSEDFTVFDASHAGLSGEHATAPLGHFFTADRKLAQRYAENAAEGRPANERVVDAYLKIEKPYRMSVAEAQAIETPADARAFRAKLEAAGHDGIRIPEAKSWVAFRSEQIKSVDNRGTFDAGNPDILYSRASVVKGDGASAGLPVANVERIASDFLAGYKGNIPLKIRVGKTMEEIYGPGSAAELGNAKGAYHARSGFLTIAADRVSSRADAIATLRHEVLGHYGLNTLAPADKRAVLDAIVEARAERSLRGVWEKIDRLYADKPELVRAEEVFADLAGQHRGMIGTTWDRILTLVQQGLRKVGLLQGPTSRAELRDLARRIGAGIRSGERTQKTFPADDQSQFAQTVTTPAAADPAPQVPLLARRDDSIAGADHLTPEQRAALGKITTFAGGEGLPDKLRRLTDRWRERLIQGVVDQFAPLKALNNEAYMQARLSRGTDGALEAVFLHGTPKLTDGALDVSADGKGLRGVLAGLKGEHDLFLAWIAGNRAARLKADGREHLFSPAEIRSLQSLDGGVMADGRDRRATYKAALADFNRYQRAVLDIGQQAGLFTAQGRAQWSHEFYVPFFRDLARKPAAAGAAEGAQFAQTGTDKVVHELKGGASRSATCSPTRWRTGPAS